MVFIGLEKAYDRIFGDLKVGILMKKGLLKVFINVIRNMYERSSTRVNRGLYDETEDFSVRVNSPEFGSEFLLISFVIDEVIKDIQDDVPWCILLVDYIIMV